MKKLLAILLALALMFTFAACGGKGDTDDGSSSQNNSTASTFEQGVDDNSSSEEEKLVLDGSEEFVVCALEDSGITLKSIADIKNYKVAYAGNGSDAEAIANYYADADKISSFGSPQDGISAFKAKNFDLFIMKKGAAKSYESQGIKIVLDPIVVK